MEAEFWRQRWQNQEIGFHQQDYNTYLQRYWPQLGLPAGSRVLVPCCGKSLDMLWLREQGYAVIGIELSSRAVEDFFNDNALKALRRQHEHFECWETDDLQILCGDLFDVRAQDLGQVDAVYDRAALIAMPPEMRRRYSEQLLALLPHAVPMLLVTMEYPDAEMAGPPFSVTEEEVRDCYAGYYDIQVLQRSDILADEPRFIEKGLTHLDEAVYLLKARK